MERLIQFPFPKYSKCFSNENLLRQTPYCLCYQYNIEINEYGPYGFDTIKARSILQNSFPKLYFWDNTKKDFIKVEPRTLENGLYFYDNELWVESEKKNVYSYFTQIKKNDFLKKRGKTVEEIQNIPLLLEIYKNDSFNIDVLNQFLASNINFFIVQFFTPEAGRSLIFFDNSFIKKIEYIAKNESVNLITKTSINELKSW